MVHYVNDRRKFENAQKRGGGKPPISIEEEIAEGRFQNEPAEDLSPEQLFDRKWAMVLINDTEQAVKREFAEQGKEAIFEQCRGFLTDSPSGGEYRETHFPDIVGGNEECIGPFSDYQSARSVWAKHAWQTHHRATRYRIECIDPDEAPPCTD